jgi:hypothetical protein
MTPMFRTQDIYIRMVKQILMLQTDRRYALAAHGSGEFPDCTYVASAQQDTRDVKICVPPAMHDGCVPRRSEITTAFSISLLMSVNTSLTSIELLNIVGDALIFKLFTRSRIRSITLQHVRLLASSDDLGSWSQIWQDAANSLPSWPCLVNLCVESCGYVVNPAFMDRDTPFRIKTVSAEILQDDEHQLKNLQHALTIRAGTMI